MSEDNHLVKNIEINNFKCFKDFKAEGFGRVNLIGGKNNVGKTAFMEAIYINVRSQELSSFCGGLFNIKYMRENLNILRNYIDSNKNITTYKKKFIEESDGVDITSNQNEVSFNIEEKDGIKKYHFKYKKEATNVNINEFSYTLKHIGNIVFINNFGFSNQNIIISYSAVQKKDKESYLNDILQKFDSQIEAFKIIDKKTQCKTSNGYREITEFGDGVRHLISIVISLFKTENGYLFIDEIDNGIHYTQLDTVWEIIMKMAYDLNVQVFATTHSKECIESYARVAKKLEDEEIRFIELFKHENEIKSMFLDNKMIDLQLQQNHEVR